MINADPALRFALAYNEVFTPRVTPATSPSEPYDAFYLFAYAAAALGAEPLQGPALAAAIPRLLPPGEPVDVGPTGIYHAFVALGAGRHIDLRGAGTSLDLDVETGETSAEYALFCMAPPTAKEPARQVEAGLVFDGGRRVVRGARRCP